MSMNARLVYDEREGSFCVGRWSPRYNDWTFYMGHMRSKEFALKILKEKFNWGWGAAHFEPGELLATVARERQDFGPSDNK